MAKKKMGKAQRRKKGNKRRHYGRTKSSDGSYQSWMKHAGKILQPRPY